MIRPGTPCGLVSRSGLSQVKSPLSVSLPHLAVANKDLNVVSG